MTDVALLPVVALKVPRHRATFAFAALIGLCVVTLAITAVAFPPDGHAHGGDLWRFAGRLHPMLVHVPIGLLLLVPVLEIVGSPRRLRHLRSTAGFVLGLGAIAALVAAIHGYVLARFDGFSGTGLTWHLWAGVTTTALAAVTLALRPVSAIAYAGTLIALLVALTIAGHLGGQLTQGDDYLSKYAPRAIARFLGPVERDRPSSPPVVPLTATTAESIASTEPTTMPTTAQATTPTAVAPTGPVTFAGDVAPMFAESCVSCHGPAKVKGELRLDTYELAMKGGESGPAIVAGDATASDLFNRMTLPLTDDDVMPPANARHRPTPQQVEAVKRWIADGAKP